MAQEYLQISLGFEWENGPTGSAGEHHLATTFGSSISSLSIVANRRLDSLTPSGNQGSAQAYRNRGWGVEGLGNLQFQSQHVLGLIGIFFPALTHWTTKDSLTGTGSNESVSPSGILCPNITCSCKSLASNS